MLTDAQKRARNKYNSTLKTIVIRIKPELYAKIEQYAKLSELSVRAFILTAIDEKMKRIDELSNSSNCQPSATDNVNN